MGRSRVKRALDVVKQGQWWKAGWRRATWLRRRTQKTGAYTPKLLGIFWSASLALLAVGYVTQCVYLSLRAGSLIIWPIPRSWTGLDSQEAFKRATGVFALVAAVLTAVYAYRKQRLSEGESRRADAVEFSRRYEQAAAQLGDQNAAAIRLAGAYAMARLADDWEDQRQTCIDVLCAYLRMPFESDPEKDGFRPGENEVRNTIQRIIQTHLKPHNRDKSQPSWSSYDFDLASAHLHNADFGEAMFSGHARFNKAMFSGDAGFNGATFSGDAGFNGATFSGDAGFNKATFSGHARFDGATFSTNAVFNKATFSVYAGFNGATFSGYAVFNEAILSEDAGFNKATFYGNARFNKATFPGDAWFNGTLFSEDARFNKATFSVYAGFSGATFSVYAGFSGATFSGDAGFDGATFSGDAEFDEAIFAKIPRFTRAVFHQLPGVKKMTIEQQTELNGVSFLEWPEPNRARLETT